MTTAPENPTLTIAIQIRGYLNRARNVAAWPTEVPGLAVIDVPLAGTDVMLYVLAHISSGCAFGGPWSSLHNARRGADALEAELSLDWTVGAISPSLQPRIYEILQHLRNDLGDWPVGRVGHVTDPGRDDT
jgi:hypothetical protein